MSFFERYFCCTNNSGSSGIDMPMPKKPKPLTRLDEQIPSSRPTLTAYSNP